ncbi:MAG: peptidylprolyl isomerase [Planctomycetota bacterium]|nr:peptidylprolyl isomerase [Planctomycetota bacterium]
MHKAHRIKAAWVNLTMLAFWLALCWLDLGFSGAAAWGQVQQASSNDSQTQVPTAGEMFAASHVVAVVGEERVLVGDLYPADKVTVEMLNNPEFQMHLRKSLKMSIQQKCLAQYFVNSQASGKPKKERDDIRAKMMSKTAEIFRTKVLPEQVKKAKLETEAEFIQLLEEQGTSLASMMRSFAEQVWADQALREGVKEKPTIYLEELRDYYDEHSEQWKRPSRVKFRILSAVFKQYPNRDAAYQAVVEMWNQVYYGGAPFEAVAKKLSTGFSADEGGNFDWTRRGALKSKQIEEAIFTIPVRALSQVIEDTDGFHVVEVLERQDAYEMTFPQAQGEIRESILKTKRTNLENDYKKKIQDLTPIWTRWPQDIPGSRDISELL